MSGLLPSNLLSPPPPSFFVVYRLYVSIALKIPTNKDEPREVRIEEQ
jgi:hypothetical protein